MTCIICLDNKCNPGLISRYRFGNRGKEKVNTHGCCTAWHTIQRKHGITVGQGKILDDHHKIGHDQYGQNR